MKKEIINKRLHDLNTFYIDGNEINYIGLDEFGNEFRLTMDAYEFLEWVDIIEIKSKLIQYIEDK
tara:strand:+ start:787 stop:981 length:195 start_codon:yes stop_codon:yes gene_type:complete